VLAAVKPVPANHRLRIDGVVPNADLPELDAEQLAFGPRRNEVTEANGLGRRIGLRVSGRLPIFDDRPSAVLVTHLPVTGVRAHEGQVRAGIARPLEAVSDSPRPVLVMAGGDDQPVAQ
jgi:hypothetical protein